MERIEIYAADESVCAEPKPRVRFRAFGNSALEFELLCWVEKPPLRGQVTDVLLTALNKRFNTERIEIPFGKHDIHIKQWPEGMLNAARD